MMDTNIMGVRGQFQRVLKFDAPVEAAYAYFTDFNFVLPRLPEVDRVLRFKDGRYRMIFSADDGRGHGMGVVFDIRHEVEENRIVKLIPVPVHKDDLAKDKKLAGSGPMFPGSFRGEASFNSHGHFCEVVYRIELNIEIEVPRFLNFIPPTALQKMGDSLMNFKMNSVGDGMSRRTPHEFNEWCELNVDRLTHITPHFTRKAPVATTTTGSPFRINMLKDNTGVDLN